MDRIDIFPRPSGSVERLREYPSIGALMDRNDVHHFCLYADETGKICFQRREFTDNVRKTVKAHFKECKKMYPFRKEGVDWLTLTNKYARPPCQGDRKNADTRTGYKIGSDYLVKAYFTFGLRKVEEGTAHVIQTLEAPLLFYLRPNDPNVKLNVRHLPVPVARYDKRVLEPNRCYRVPPTASYFLLSCQKNFFRFDVVRDDFPVPFPHVDPVAVRVTKIAGMYDRPVETPFADDRPDEREFARTFLGTAEEEDMDDLIRFQEPTFQEQNFREQNFREQGQNLQEPTQNFQRQTFQGQTSSGPFQNFQEQNFQESTRTLQEQTHNFQGSHGPTQAFQEQNFQAGQTFLLISDPPVLRRTVTVAPAEFLPLYRSVSEKVYGPPVEELPSRFDGWCPEPMDLSSRADGVSERVEESLEDGGVDAADEISTETLRDSGKSEGETLEDSGKSEGETLEDSGNLRDETLDEMDLDTLADLENMEGVDFLEEELFSAHMV